MKNITIISDFCYPNFAGGLSKHVYDLLMNFPQDRYNVKLLTRARTSGNSYLANDKQAKDHYIRIFQKGNIRELTLAGIFNPLKYFDFIKGADYVLLQYPVMGVVGGLTARMLGKRIIYHYHGPVHIEYKYKTGRQGFKYKVLWGIQKLTTMISDKVLVHSDYMRDIAVKKHNVREDKFEYVPPYIDRNQKNDAGMNNEIPDDGKIKLLIPRRLTARTGVLEFLNQFIGIDEDLRKKFVIYVTGCGELANVVEEIARNFPESVKYMGFVSYERLQELYNEVDSVVVPTIDLEGCGLVILESLSCGTSVIVSKTCGGGYEFIKKHVGESYVFDVFKQESIVNTLNFIAGQPRTPEFYKEIAEDFDIKKMIEHYSNNILN